MPEMSQLRPETMVRSRKNESVLQGEVAFGLQKAGEQRHPFLNAFSPSIRRR